MTCTFLELYGSIVVLQLSTQKSSPHLVAQLDGVRAEIESHVLVQLSPSFQRRRFPFHRVDADAGAEQWYKTIAKLMQGRNSNSTLTSEPRVGLFSGRVPTSKRIVATWLILPVVICLS